MAAMENDPSLDDWPLKNGACPELCNTFSRGFGPQPVELLERGKSWARWPHHSAGCFWCPSFATLISQDSVRNIRQLPPRVHLGEWAPPIQMMKELSACVSWMWGGSKHWLWKSQASRMVYLRLTKPKRNMLVALCLTSFGHINFKSRGCQLRIKLFNQLRLTVCCFAERNQSAISGAWHKVHQIVAKTWKSCVLVRDLNKCLASIYIQCQVPYKIQPYTPYTPLNEASLEGYQTCIKVAEQTTKTRNQEYPHTSTQNSITPNFPIISMMSLRRRRVPGRFVQPSAIIFL